MANPYYNNTTTLVTFTRERAEVVEAKFTAVAAGFDSVYAALQLLAPSSNANLIGATCDTPPTTPASSTRIVNVNFVSTNFAPIASPIFTGNPQAPTPLTSDNSSSVATTAWFNAKVVGLALTVQPTQDFLLISQGII